VPEGDEHEIYGGSTEMLDITIIVKMEALRTWGCIEQSNFVAESNKYIFWSVIL